MSICADSLRLYHINASRKSLQPCARRGHVTRACLIDVAESSKEGWL